MISKFVGNVLKGSTKTRAGMLKLAVALVLSNVFFFLLFSGGKDTATATVPDLEGWVEVQLRAELFTPFQSGKKIILLNRQRRQHLQGMLQGSLETDGKVTVLVRETEAQHLFQEANWEVLPYVTNLTLPTITKGEGHEIRY